MSKEKLIEEENISKVKSSTQEVVKDVTYEEKIIPTMDVMSMIGKKPLKKNKNWRKMENKGNVKVSETIVEEDTQHDLKGGKILGVGVEVSEHKKNENFQELVKALEKIKANIPIKEIVEKSHCCMRFLQEILKLKEKPSNEDFISLTQNCCRFMIFRYHDKKENLNVLISLLL